MSDEQEQMDYEAHNAKVALDLNKAQQDIEHLTADLMLSQAAEALGWQEVDRLTARNKALEDKLRAELKRQGWDDDNIFEAIAAADKEVSDGD